MKITKEEGDYEVGVYTPDEDEKELMYEVSDKVIDLITSYNLTDDQHIHLISSLYVSMKDMYKIEGMKHMEDSQSD